MRAIGPLVLCIFIKTDRAEDADMLAAIVRDRATELGLTDVALRQDATGPVIKITGNEEGLRRFWTGARDLGDLGLMMLQAA